MQTDSKMVYTEFEWVLGVGIVVSLFLSFGGGANDLANAFGSTVGSKALTLKQVVIVASIFEFLGALLLGASVTDTIRSKIADISVFTNTPDLLMYGMLCAMLAAGLWLLFATMYEFPVSFTHSTIGGIIGMSIACHGFDSVVWSESSDEFPYVKGVTSVMLGWLFSPLLAGIGSIIIFLFTRTFVLRAPNSFNRAMITFPFYVFATVMIVSMFIMKKGIPNLDSKIKDNDGTIAWIAAITAAATTLIVSPIAIWWIRKRVALDMEAHEAAQNAPEEGAEKAKAMEEAAPQQGDRTRMADLTSQVRRSKIWTGLTHGINVDVHSVAHEGAEDYIEKVGDVHSHSETFDRKTEFGFKYLQVFTASMNMFAHGSNDVANGIGPLAAIYAAYKCSCSSSKAPVPEWILAVGAFGMCAGLAVLGYKIVRVLGVKMMRLSNSRGFSLELAAAIVVIVASRFGLPVSTTQTITGAITGIGILECFANKTTRSYNWFLLVKFFAGWVATLFLTACIAWVITAFGVKGPNANMSNQRAAITTAMNSTSFSVANNLVNLGYTDEGNATLTALDELSKPMLDQMEVFDIYNQQHIFLNATIPAAA